MKETLHAESVLSRRALMKMFAVASGTAAGATWFPEILAQRAPAAGGRAGRGAAAAPAASGTRLIMLGTQGGPSVNLSRAETSAVITVDGAPYLIDCGYGAVRGLNEAGIGLASIRNVFVSHLHDDHTIDLAALLSLKWTGGNTNPTPAVVHGPYGTKAMVEGAIAFFKGNVDIRSVDEGRTVRPETIFSGKDYSAPTVTEIFRDEKVRVQAVENTHFPERNKARMMYRSFAYRFNTADRSIVLSGDTAYSQNLIELARGADYFVCEAMTMASRSQYGNIDPNVESIGRHVLETHSSTEDVGRMASEAKVRNVVLYHLLPGGNRGGATDDTYISEVKRNFSGNVIVSRDQMKIPE